MMKLASISLIVLSYASYPNVIIQDIERSVSGAMGFCMHKTYSESNSERGGLSFFGALSAEAHCMKLFSCGAYAWGCQFDFGNPVFSQGKTISNKKEWALWCIGMGASYVLKNTLELKSMFISGGMAERHNGIGELNQNLVLSKNLRSPSTLLGISLSAKTLVKKNISFKIDAFFISDIFGKLSFSEINGSTIKYAFFVQESAIKTILHSKIYYMINSVVSIGIDVGLIYDVNSDSIFRYSDVSSGYLPSSEFGSIIIFASLGGLYEV